MDSRKKMEDKPSNGTENTLSEQPAFIQGWEGSLPTEPFPAGRPLTQAEKDKEKNIKWHYNPTRDQYWYLSEIPRNKKLYEKAINIDTSKSVVNLVDYSSDEEEIASDEQVKKSESPKIMGKKSIFSAPTNSLLTDELSANINSLNSKRKRS